MGHRGSRGGPPLALRLVTGVVTGLLVLVAFASLIGAIAARSARSAGSCSGWASRRCPSPSSSSSATSPPGLTTTSSSALPPAGFVAVLPLAAGLAVAKTRLYDVDRILSQAVSYLLLSALLAGTYAGVVLLLGQGAGGVAGSSTVAVAVATLAAATLAKPAHRTLQEIVDRRFSRRRYDALRMLRAHVASPARRRP